MRVRDWPGRLLAHALVLDLALVGVTTGIEIGLLSDALGAPGTPPPAFTLILTVLAGLLLLLHRRAPLTGLAGSVALEGILAVAGAYPGGAPAVVALALVARSEERRRSVPALVVTAVVLLTGSISSLPVPILAWAAGTYAQTRLRYVAALAERAGQLEREREQRDLMAARAERTAIARELHDIVAHSVTVMLLGVRGARDTLRADPDLAEEALRRVERSGEESIAELRRMLLFLREPTGDASGLAPAPTVARVPALVERHRQDGMPVTLTVTGTARPAPAGVELTAYRVVQEGLTNVVKHAGSPSEVRVILAFGERELGVSVEDEGRGGLGGGRGGPGGTGIGIRGLGERVTAVGGTLTAGGTPSPGRPGFRLAARLPLDTPEPHEKGLPA